MATLSGLPSPLQPVGSSTRVNTAQLVNNYARANVRVTSWLEQYLKQQQEEAAEKKAAEEEAAEQAAFEAQKQAHKDNADFVYEGSFVSSEYSQDQWDSSSTINPATGEPVNWFLDVEGDNYWDVWKTGGGDDVVYHKGRGQIHTGGGDDVVYLAGDVDQGTTLNSSVFMGPGDDKVVGGQGGQEALGGYGDDYFDLGDGSDIAVGGWGADEFVIDLQNTGADLIADFHDVGDKLTVLNGGVAAQGGDWYLSESDAYSGAGDNHWRYKESLQEAQQFYEIRKANGELAAVFGIGTHNTSFLPSTFALTASMSAEGIEILTSDEFYNKEVPGSIEFV